METNASPCNEVVAVTPTDLSNKNDKYIIKK